MSDPTWAFDYKISTYWTTEYQLHDDSTATILAHYRDGRRCPELMGQLRCGLSEVTHLDMPRTVIELKLYAPGHMVHNRGDLVSTHKVRNPAHVFSYPNTPIVKVGEE